jgi:large subunit ribosomal protein L25
LGEFALDAEPRKGTGKGVARKLRAAGRIPAVCYRRNTPAEPISVDPQILERLLRASSAGLNTLIDLRVTGGGAFDGRQVLVKELQRDPVSGDFLHVDLFAVDLDTLIQVSVPLRLEGTAEGVTMGGIVDHALRELELECLPDAIPEEILVDVSALDIGQSIHVRELALPEGVTLISDSDLSVVSVVAPAAVEEEAPEEEEGVEGEEAEGEEAAAGEGESATAEPSEDKSGD